VSTYLLVCVVAARGSQAIEENDEDEEGEGETRGGSRRPTTTAGGNKSLFDPSNQGLGQGLVSPLLF